MVPNRGLKLFQEVFEGGLTLFCVSRQREQGSLETLTEAAASFLVLQFSAQVPKQSLGLTCPRKQVSKHMDLSANVSIFFQKDLSWFFSSKAAESETGAAATPARNPHLVLLLAILFSSSVYTKDRPRSMVSAQPNRDTHWEVNTHTRTKRKRKRKSDSLSISLGMFICPS